MARELSQEAVLDFLWAAGGRAPNTALLRHFQRFLRDPALTEQQRRERREYFKSLVNSLATVHPAAAPGASKDIVLRRRYRDLLDEELPPPEEQPEQEAEKDPPPPRRDPDRRHGPREEVRGLFLEEPELALQRDFMSGFTVLHWLAKHGDGPGLQELAAAARQAGLTLDVDARSGCGYTPLHLAAIHGHQLVIKVLVLQLGCQVQVRDGSGRRPWEYLGSSTSGEIWQLLEAPRGTIMFPTQPLARSVSSVSKVSLSTGRATLPACLRPQHGHGAASHQTCSESD
ncbi:hypothetical protein Q9233_011772 [Columba guinea]|nr:hypothetical protein Q9233_011772 [Columba guinea]